MNEYKKALDDFINNMRSGRFYEAHEDLEALWYARRFEDSDEVKLLKGLINASVSFELRKKGKLEPSERVWKNYLKYKELIETLDSGHRDDYLLIAEEIEKIKKGFIN